MRQVGKAYIDNPVGQIQMQGQVVIGEERETIDIRLDNGIHVYRQLMIPGFELGDAFAGYDLAIASHRIHPQRVDMILPLIQINRPPKKQVAQGRFNQ